MSALWSADIKFAPHGRYEIKQRREGVDIRVFVPERVILTTKCGKVLQSYYVPDEKRWMFLHHGEQPVAWMPWPEPYSVSARGTISAVESAGEVSPPASPAANSPSLPAANPQATRRPDPLPLAGSGHQFESDSPKSLPGDAAASLTQLSNSQRQERPSAQERSSDRSGGQFGDAPKPAQIQRADGGANIVMKHEDIRA